MKDYCYRAFASTGGLLLFWGWIIALPTSDGGAVAPAVSRFLWQSDQVSFAKFTAIRCVSSRVSPSGHRLGLASLMDGTVPPLPFQLPPLSSSRAKQPG
jgi:hypothetical protein